MNALGQPLFVKTDRYSDLKRLSLDTVVKMHSGRALGDYSEWQGQANGGKYHFLIRYTVGALTVSIVEREMFLRLKLMLVGYYSNTYVFPSLESIMEFLEWKLPPDHIETED